MTRTFLEIPMKLEDILYANADLYTFIKAQVPWVREELLYSPLLSRFMYAKNCRKSERKQSGMNITEFVAEFPNNFAKIAIIEIVKTPVISHKIWEGIGMNDNIDKFETVGYITLDKMDSSINSIAYGTRSNYEYTINAGGSIEVGIEPYITEQRSYDGRGKIVGNYEDTKVFEPKSEVKTGSSSKF